MAEPAARTDDLSPEQQALWRRVNDLWALSTQRDAERIRSALHPRYVGWDTNSAAPHDREAAIRSVAGDSPAVQDYRLEPLGIEVYDHVVGIVHYTYSATVAHDGGASVRVRGKWTEIYLRQGGEWLMIGVSGRPDGPSGAPGASA